jgi:hypothetical protein
MSKQVVISESNDNVILVYIQSNTVLPGSYINAEYNLPDEYKLQLLENVANGFTKPIPTNNVKYKTNTKIISTYNDVIEHFKPASDKYFITGVTESKITLISNFFSKNNISNINQDQNSVKRYVGDANSNVIELPFDSESNNLIRSKIKLTIPGMDISAMILNENQSGIVEYVLYLDTENPIKYIDLGNGLSNFMFMRSHEYISETPNMVIYDNIIEEPKIISEVFIDRGVNSAFERMKKLKNIKDLNELTRFGLGYYKINTKGYNFKK